MTRVKPFRRLSVALVLLSLVAGVLGQRSPAASAAQTRPAGLTPFPRPEARLLRASEDGTTAVTIKRAGRDLQTVVFQQATAPDGRTMRAGSLLVKFRPGATVVAREAAHRAAGALNVHALTLPGSDRVQLDPDTLARAVATYAVRPEVERVEPDYIVQGSFRPNDTYLDQQWGMVRIAAPTAWDSARGSANVKIAILDCGIWSGSSARVAADGARGHNDLVAKVVQERNFTPSPYGADDLCGHGTHVAAIAAAATDNGVGVAGVGFQTAIMNAKVLDDDGAAAVSTVLEGIIWAANNGAQVINLSLGGVGLCPPAVQEAIDYAWARGAVIVAAAGNESLPISGAPGNCANVLSVAATDIADGKAAFSNVGAGVDVAAPGVGILSAYADDLGYGYAMLDGTSQAAPHVAGLAALLWSTPYGTSNQAVVDRITATADRVPGTGTLWAHGRINVAAAVATSTATPTGSRTCSIGGLVYSADSPQGRNVVTAGAANGATLVGTDGPDLIIGSDGDDIIDGKGGDDVICGGAGNDLIDGGPGDDLIKGGSGVDVILGHAGNDRIWGGGGADTLHGGFGDDQIKGGSGDDQLLGEDGNDALFGGIGDDRCEGGLGTDTADSSCETLVAVP